jgi:DNA polymerase III delta prime subunit
MWLNKYKAKSLDEYVGNRKAVYSLKKWYEKEDGNIVIINGQTGIGKTLLAELFFTHYNLIINSLSNCEEKNNTLIKEKIEKLLNFQNILEIMNNKKVGIIVKDIDNLLVDVIKIITQASIKRTVFIITNCNVKKIIQNNKNVLLLNLERPSFTDIDNFILKLSLENKFYLNNDSIKNLYNHSNGDIRYIINFLEDLYMYIHVKKKSEDSFITVSSDEINELIKTKHKDIDYSLYDLVNKLLFNKNTIDETLTFVHHDVYFLPTIVYDNISVMLESNNGLKYYSSCLESIVISEYLNIKEFEYQTRTSNDIRLVLNTHLPNYYLSLVNNKKKTVKYSVLMNKLLKMNNAKKYYCDMEFKMPKQIQITHYNEIIKFSKYIDNKQNTDKTVQIKDLFETYDINFKKLIKYFDI